MKRLRALPPAGTVIPTKVLLKGLMGALGPGDARSRLEDEIQQRYGARKVYMLNSGRAVLTVLLEAMQAVCPEKSEVILPGYTCYSVAAAAVRAGLKVRPVDICLDTLDYDFSALERVDTSNVLVLITANLFGIANDLVRLEAFCKERGIFMIDDAAQAMHARVGERWVGAFGDAGVFSLGKGKNVTTIEGGVLLLQNPKLLKVLEGAVGGLPEPQVGETWAVVLKSVLYWVFFRPWLYWLPDRMLPLGKTPWELVYPVKKYHSALAPLALSVLALADEVVQVKKHTAEILGTRLMRDVGPDGSMVATIRGRPVTRLPVLAESTGVRLRILQARRAHRLGIRQMYPEAMMDVWGLESYMADGVAPTPNARIVADRLFTVPTHQWVREREMQEIAQAIAVYGRDNASLSDSF